jgi:hypothetical protein
MSVTKSKAIKNFLDVKTHKSLADLYHLGMECQVNVAQGTGERVEGDYKGRQWHGWTDGATVWKSFRIPWNANTTPNYTDSNIKFDLEVHAEGIGMTGWDWQERVSRWVAYDFDAIIGHSDKHAKKLTNEQLTEVQEAALQIPWVTVRKSTSGKGLHLYVFLDNIPTANHTEHQALARSILGMMSALTCFDFVSKVDICGGNMWVWHRKMLGTDGLTLVKAGEVLDTVPKNWRDHVKVITKRGRKNLPQEIIESGKSDDFMELTGQRPYVPLDADHKRLIDWLRSNKALWWWEQDHHMLVTHTFWLKKAFDALNLKGIYETTSEGRDLNEQNCFAFPLRRGAWVLRRYSQGASEHDCWDQDSNGWTRCFYNRPPDLATACRAFGGMEDPSGGWIFRTASDASQAAEKLGVYLNIGTVQAGRKTKIRRHKDKKRIVVEVDHEGHDAGNEMDGWLLKKGKPWTKIETPNTPNATEPDDLGNYDDFVRHLVTPNDNDSGWMIKSNNRWRSEPLTHIKHALSFMGFGPSEINQILGSAVFKAWRDVNKPFQPEYPGDREWNRNAAQLRFVPTQNKDELKFPNWMKILEHCGSGLTEAIKRNAWAKANGILNGADYLKCWIASVFQYPEEPLPYLFFYGPQNSGKSIFHESLNILLTKGYKRADIALMNQSGFNGELEGGIVCVIEETDMNRDRQAYNRIKDWVLSPEISIHIKGKTPFHAINTTHWIQCANDHTYCPIFSGDTRIVMCYVPPLDPLQMIPKKKMRLLLEKEAPDFLADIMSLDIPESPDRLHIPPIFTEDKHMAEQMNQNPLERFLSERCKPAPGYTIPFKQFHERFMEWIESDEVRNWGKIKTSRSLPPQYPKARIRKSCAVTIGNIAWEEDEVDANKRPFIIVDGYLVPSDA